MKTSCLTRQLALAALVFAVAIFSDSNAAASGGGSWGGSLGGGSLGSGLAGGSWGGSAGGFRTPVRDFFAYRQPVRNLLRGVASGLRAGFGPRYGSAGGYGSAGAGYGSAGAGYGSYGGSGIAYSGASYSGFSGGAGSGGYSYYGSPAAGTSFISTAPAMPVATGAPMVTAPVTSTVGQPLIMDNSLSSGAAMPYSDPNYYGDSTILDSGTLNNAPGVISSGTYYDEGTTDDGTGSVINNTEVRGFDTPPTPEPASNDDSTMLRQDSILNVSVPSHARVFVNDRLTKTAGTNRSYVSRRLKTNKDYPFHVRAEIEQDGQTISLDRKVVMRGGESETVNFDFQKPLLTQLTVKVPENSQVKLCGKDTAAKGAVRNFKTRLTPGKVWEGYQVEVSMEVDGQTVTQQRTVTIKAGGRYVVDFASTEDLYAAK